MGYAIVYIRGSDLDVKMPRTSEVKVSGILKEVTITFLGKTGKVLKFANEYAVITFKGLALNVRYIAKDLVIVEGLLESYEVRPEESLTVTLYTFEQPELQEPDLDEF
jgi:hypothetical protein